ncbi:hypothetical protein QCA50_007736 [Cerrena zonata]|uniref:Uncharacterized protein n=1 Tax=Cerrena zonata TaxID=2478898 RepID=A0AAW0GD13_9APHY
MAPFQKASLMTKRNLTEFGQGYEFAKCVVEHVPLRSEAPRCFKDAELMTLTGQVSGSTKTRARNISEWIPSTVLSRRAPLWDGYLCYLDLFLGFHST